MVGSLEGVRVLELARYQAGPRGGMILSDLGAEVIKINWVAEPAIEPLVRPASILGLQPRRKPLPRLHAARPGYLRRWCRPPLCRLPSRHDGADGVRLRPLRALSQTSSDLGVGFVMTPRAPGLRPARRGDGRLMSRPAPVGTPLGAATSWSTATPHCMPRSARSRHCTTATAPAKGAGLLS
jgi:hypothetical protein